MYLDCPAVLHILDYSRSIPERQTLLSENLRSVDDFQSDSSESLIEMLEWKHSAVAPRFPRACQACIDNTLLSFHIAFYNELIRQVAVMAAEILARPLVRLAKHEFACARAARNSLFNNSRRHTSGSHYSTHAFIPDFLLPAFMIGKPAATPSFHAFPPPRQPTSLNISHTRHFSASPATKATVVTANPRKDEDGNEMLIEITARAATVCVCSEHPSGLRC